MPILGIIASSMQGATAPVVIFARTQSPYIAAFPWNAGSFGTQYADPTTPFPAGDVYRIAFDSKAKNIVTSHLTSPYTTAYPWSSGFGSKYANPASAVTQNASSATFSPDDSVVIVQGSSANVAAYAWSSTGFGSRYSNPATLPAGVCYDVRFSPNGTHVAFAHITTPFVTAYPWSSGFGTKYANPASLPANAGRSVDFSKNGAAIVVGQDGSPYVSAYPWSSGFGTKYSAPATTPLGVALGTRFHPSENVVGLAVENSRGIQAYAFTSASGWGTKYADPSLDAGTTKGNGLSWNRDGTYVAVATDASNLCAVYPWSAGFGSRVFSPISGGSSRDVAMF